MKTRFCSLFVFFAIFAFGQVDTGSITGTVRDSSGAVIVGAQVVVRNDDTGQSLSLTTNSVGFFGSGPLRPAHYTVEVESTGFQAVAKRITLDVSQRAVVNFELELGQLTEVVTVQDTALILETETSTLSDLRTETEIKDLPLNDRNFARLLNLSAGVIPAQSQQGGVPFTMARGVTGYSVNGTRLEENNFLVDGLNNNENHNGLGIILWPSIEAIEAFRVESSVSDPQFGRGGGGTINITYKSGTKDFHGGVYHFIRNEKLDAKNFFDSPDEGVPPFKMNQFGAFLGGPLARGPEPRTFFFLNFEGRRIRQSRTFISSVATDAFKQGNFALAGQQIFDPLTQRSVEGGGFERDPFPGNRIPVDRIDQVGQNIVNLYPAPNLPGDNSNFLFNPVRQVDGERIDFKVDHTFSESDSMFGRYSWGDESLLTPGSLPPPALGGSGDDTDLPVNQIVLSETHILSANKVNEFRAGWTRLNIQSVNLNFGKNLSDEIGVPGANVNDLTTGLPRFSMSGFTLLGDNGFRPGIVVTDNIQFSDNFSYVRGKHSLKVGGEVQRRRYNAFQTSLLRGEMVFSTAFTQNPASPAGTGQGVAEALLGRPIRGELRFVDGTRGLRRTEYGFYVMDVFKATQKLTITLGLRYENFIGWPWQEVNDRMYQFVPELQDLVRVGTDPVPWRSGTRGDNNNLSPRIGLAYQLSPNTVFRAGYGAYFSSPMWDVTRNLSANPPEFGISAFSNSQFDFAGARPVGLGFDRPPAGVIPDGSSLRAIDVNARTPYTQQWNAAIQRQLPSSISLTLAYVGTKGTKLQGFPDGNQPVPGTTPVAQRRPYPRFNTIQWLQNRYNSVYHGLQITAERRFSQGLGFQAAYTYSHVIDDVNAQFGGSMNIRDLRADRGNAVFDVPQRLVLSWMYEVPFKADGPLNHLVGGWQLNAIGNLYDGVPFSVNSATNSLNIGSGTRGDRLGDGALSGSQRTLQRWFDIDAFSPPGPQMFGNSGRNILRGPGTKQLDFSVFKDFLFGENQVPRIEFRAEFFNITNTPQFNNPNSTVGSSAAGRITSAGSTIFLQRIPRQIQLGLKFYF